METTQIIEEKREFGFKIDRKKWKAAVEAVEAARENRKEIFKKSIDDYCSKMEEKNITLGCSRGGFNDYVDLGYAEQLTKLYSIRAHARGRMHRRVVRMNATDWCYKLGNKTPSYRAFDEAGGMLKFTLTLADQALYIGDSWKEYEAAPEEIPVQE